MGGREARACAPVPGAAAWGHEAQRLLRGRWCVRRAAQAPAGAAVGASGGRALRGLLALGSVCEAGWALGRFMESLLAVLHH